MYGLYVFTYFFRVLRKVLSFFVCLDLCASCLLMLMSFLPGAAVNGHLPSASPSLCARCCFRRFPGIGVGLGIENDES